WEAGVEQGILWPMFVLRAGHGQAVAFRRPFGNVVTPDAEFIAHARTAIPALLGFVREVRELHRPTPIHEECATDRPTALCDRDDHLELGGGQWVHESEVLYDACEDCRDEDGSWVEWPCPTEQAARKWVGGEGRG